MTELLLPPAAAGAAQALRFDPPAAVKVRGTVLVSPGRGETAQVYARFCRRLSADGYLVLVGGPVDVAQDVVRPVVLVGADTGAARVLATAAEDGAAVDALVLAGWSDGRAAELDDWDDELDARTACPTHRTLLETGAVEPGRLAHEDLRPANLSTRTDLPVLVLHGAADRVLPLDDALAALVGISHAVVVTVEEGRHDVLNDVSHRSVAARVVQFLEDVRRGPGAEPLLTERVIGA